MDEYISRQKAIEAVNRALDKETLLYSFVRKVAISVLKFMPAADVIPVVRCHECKYVTKWRSGESAKKFGQVYECEREVFTCPDPNDFCCRGKREE